MRVPNTVISSRGRSLFLIAGILVRPRIEKRRAIQLFLLWVILQLTTLLFFLYTTFLKYALQRRGHRDKWIIGFNAVLTRGIATNKLLVFMRVETRCFASCTMRSIVINGNMRLMQIETRSITTNGNMRLMWVETRCIASLPAQLPNALLDAFFLKGISQAIINIK